MARDAVGDAAKLHFTGRLARQVRDAEGLLAVVPVAVRRAGRASSSGAATGCRWPATNARRLRLRATARGRASARARCSARSVWDVQHKFRIVIGPLRLASYLAFLPGGADLERLQAIVRQWVGSSSSGTCS